MKINHKKCIKNKAVKNPHDGNQSYSLEKDSADAATNNSADAATNNSKDHNEKNEGCYGVKNGSMILELVLVLPVFLLVLAAIVQFGFILSARIAVNSAAYEAARAATISSDPYSAAMHTIESYASSSFPGWSFNERLRAAIDVPDLNPYTQITVEVYYSVPVFFKNIPAISALGGQDIDVKGSSRMRIEEKE